MNGLMLGSQRSAGGDVAPAKTKLPTQKINSTLIMFGRFSRSECGLTATRHAASIFAEFIHMILKHMILCKCGKNASGFLKGQFMPVSNERVI